MVVVEVFAVCAVLPSILVSAHVCTPSKLSDKAFDQCGQTGFAMKCNGRRLDNIPSAYPIPSPPLSGPACVLDLSDNNISVVENKTFTEAKHINSTEISYLYLNKNHLNCLKSEAFVGLSNLKYLNLSHNNLLWKDSFAPEVFAPLINLENINLKCNTFDTFDGLGQELMLIKRLEGLFITPSNYTNRYSFGESFLNISLKYLYLSSTPECDCNLKEIDNNSFRNLSHIERLYVKDCHIENVTEEAFKPLNETIKVLDISGNSNLTFKGMNKVLKGLINSPTLKELNVNRIHVPYNIGIEITPDDLQSLNTLHNLEKLFMDLNKIEVFNVDTLYPKVMFPPSLTLLTLAGNRLTFGKYVDYLFMARNIKTLDISRQFLGYDPFRFRKHNTLPHISSETPSAKVCDAKNKPVHVRKESVVDINEGYIWDFALQKMLISNDEIKNMTRGDWAALFANFQNAFDVNCTCNVSVARQLICLPEHLSHIQWSRSYLYGAIPPVLICGAKHVKFLDLSYNLLSPWTGPVFGLHRLKKLDLSENYCTNISKVFFFGFQNLEALNLTGNMLEETFHPNNADAGVMFGNQKKMKNLTLSAINVSNLHQDLLNSMVKLERLDLSYNHIHKWNLNLKSYCFHHLDITSNRLSSLPKDLMAYLDQMAESKCIKTKRINVTVYMSQNPLECSCEQLPFWQWIVTSTVNVHPRAIDSCMLNGKVKQITTDDEVHKLVKLLENDICIDRTWRTWAIAGGSLLIGVIVTITLGTATYKNRWKIRYVMYSRGRRYRHEGFEHMFSHDAMISYSKGRASFIKNLLVPSLEQRHQLDFWIADRNSQAGVSVAENITHAICTSRKVVLLVDNEYLSDSWCDYDLNMALVESVETKRNMIIVVLMEQIQMNTLPVPFLRLLKTEGSLEYPDQQQDIETFLTNLAEEIKS
ncbi:toll-like receptor 4 isoform X2 [Mya arenaria]|uniref:toll-like receptor 4 isoform X2 n=1 Tax=Mya arenaria TaxID=6604 RepID=UPI0022E6D15F|nr:toll-like receptor 4 isoform X2 [Mya arenaria]